jgi:hypothetical protein
VCSFAAVAGGVGGDDRGAVAAAAEPPGQPDTVCAGAHRAQHDPVDLCPPAAVQKPTGGLHSLTVGNDGSRTYYALLTGGFPIVDASEFATGAAFPQLRPITVNESGPVWPGPGAAPLQVSG